MNLEKELEYAIEVARGAGRIVLEHFGHVARLTKRHDEAVTEADRASQRYIVAALRKRFPSYGIIGEENETGDAITFECPDPGGRVWVIDPIDGTNNFVVGFPAFGVCIGLLEAGQPVLGVVLDVCQNSIYAGARGMGVKLNGRPVRVNPEPLGEGSLLLLTSNLLGPDGKLPQYAVRWISQTAWKVRIIGSAALEAAQVACGVGHASLTSNGKLWDVAAPSALVLEAGGVVSDLKGKPIFPFDLAHYSGAKVPFLTGTPAAHKLLLEEILTYP